jgi:putative N6-adenine-specific DNA methylase
MCGSGTLAIEAALYAANIPPGIFGRHYGFENWKDFDPALMKNVLESLPRETESKVPIIASDINFNAIRVAREHVRNTELESMIKLEKRDFETYDAWDEPVTMIINPPYGERMNPTDLNLTYKMIGATLKHKFPGSEAWILSSNREAVKQIGLKPSVKKILFNGGLECQYLNYRTFSGSYKDYKGGINQ